MSEQIVERLIDSVTDRRLVLLNSQCARQLSIGSTWNSLRIGLRCAVQGVTGPLPFRLFFGLTNGTQHVWASDYCQHALGALLVSGTSVAYSALYGGYFSMGVANPTLYKKVGQTETSVNASYIGYSSSYIAADATTRNCVMILELIKNGGGSFTAQCTGPWSSATYSGNRTYEQLMTGMLALTLADVASMTSTHVGYSRTGSGVDETTYGAFDSVCVYWKHPTIGLEISDLLVVRLS